MNRLEAVQKETETALRAADPALSADAGFVDGLRKYLAELVEWNEAIHLTGRGRFTRAVAEQVCDSVTMLRCAEEAISERGETGTTRVADIGSGAGFPGIIWKLVRPDWDLTLIERRERTAAYLARTVVSLGLEGIAVIEGDARAIGADGFDIVVSKAAGRFPEIIPVAQRIARAGGFYVTAKGDSWEGELAEAPTGEFEPAGVRAMGSGRGFAIALRLLSP